MKKFAKFCTLFCAIAVLSVLVGALATYSCRGKFTGTVIKKEIEAPRCSRISLTGGGNLSACALQSEQYTVGICNERTDECKWCKVPNRERWEEIEIGSIIACQ